MTPSITTDLGMLSPERREYILHALIGHLVVAEEHERLQHILTNLDFLEMKLATLGLQSLVDDYDVVLSKGMVREADTLRMIQGVLRVAAHILTEDHTQLRSQLYARLQTRLIPPSGQLFQMLQRERAAPWLRLLHGSVRPPHGMLLRTIRCSESIRAVAVFTCGSRAVTVTRRTLTVWNIVTGEHELSLHTATHAFTTVGVTTDGQYIVSGSNDGTVSLWDLQRGCELYSVHVHTAAVNALAVCSKTNQIVSASNDRTLKVWDLEHGTELHTLYGHSGAVNSVALLNEGRQAISSSDDGTLRVWNLEVGAELYILSQAEHSVGTVAVTADGQSAASIGRTGPARNYKLKLWNLGQRCLRAEYNDRRGNISSVALSTDGRWIVTGDGPFMHVLDVEQGVVLYTVRAHVWDVFGIALTPDNKRIVSISTDRTLKVWSLDTPPEEPAPAFRLEALTSVAITPNGRTAVSAGMYGNLQVWDTEHGAVRHPLNGHTSTVTALAMIADGQQIISASRDTTIRVWDVQTGAELACLTAHSECVLALAASEDGRWLISGGGALAEHLDSTVRVWDLERKQELHVLYGHTKQVTSVAITTDGRFAVSGSSDRTLKLWDVQAGREVCSFVGHKSNVTSVALTRNGRSIISAAHDGEIKIWDLATRKERCTYHIHHHWDPKVIVMPDDHHILSCARDETLKVWNLETGKIIAAFTCDFPLVTCAVAQDGATIVTGTEDGRVHFLRLEGSLCYNTSLASSINTVST